MGDAGERPISPSSEPKAKNGEKHPTTGAKSTARKPVPPPTPPRQGSSTSVGGAGDPKPGSSQAGSFKAVSSKACYSNGSSQTASSKPATSTSTQDAGDYEPTPQDLAEWKPAFDMVDKSRTGTILASDFGLFLRGLGLDPSQADLATMVQEVDLDRDGVISLKDWVRYMNRRTAHEESMEELREVFDKFADKQGVVTMDGLGKLLRFMGENPTEVQLRNYIIAADTNLDSRIDFDEFVELMESRN
ncbi:hypothetical protein QBC47DRAFT_355555 [Echria macrotheca]|uniref:Calmodulin n=1 Tax=Echria macrotheca TaxID=438768 RepID=A0AAJ0BLF2_9PEZI|nr:hypothetical protein QBC47DRAFT_355555 [Echria macrotheca]